MELGLLPTTITIGSGTALMVILRARHILGVIPLLGVAEHSELAPPPGTGHMIILQIRHTLGVMLLLERGLSELAPLPTIITIGIGTGPMVILQVSHISAVMLLSGRELSEPVPLLTIMTIAIGARHMVILQISHISGAMLLSGLELSGLELLEPVPLLTTITTSREMGHMLAAPLALILPTLPTKPIRELTATVMAPHWGATLDSVLEQAMLVEMVLTLRTGPT